MKALLLALPSVAALVLPPLLALGGDVRAAGTMYRWSEPDGSLTYSPTAPTDGTPYEAVDPMTLRPATRGAAGASAPSPVALARDGSNESATTVRMTAGAESESAGATVAPARVDPIAESSRPDEAVRAARPALGAAVVRPDAPTLERDARTVRGAARDAETRYVVSSDKERRCDELEKRIVSLERRLATPLTPQAMDDTVVQMARYQYSVDRHCR